ncbi:MAG: STAS domain-containing protein [Bacteroidetes bacterium]|jgi:anti-sigma B factor antagonist|nr:STAS domain-containing protein [Bacteroidota bacterium]
MLQLEKQKKGTNDLLRLIGEVDASNSLILDQAIQELIQEGISTLLIDGSKLTYISSAGLGVFMSYLEEFKEKGISLVIFGLNDQVKEVFKILGLDKLIPLVIDQVAAEAHRHEV